MRDYRFAAFLISLLLAVPPAFAQATWQISTPLPDFYYLGRTVSNDSHVYRLGGLGSKGMCGARDVLYAPINSDGSLGIWAQTTPLPALSTYTLTFQCAGRDYDLPAYFIGWAFMAVQAEGHIYMLGGTIRDNVEFIITSSSAVFHAAINPDGTLGAWQQTEYLPGKAWAGGASYWNGHLYVTGGRDFPFAEASSGTYFAKIKPDGSLEPWQTATTFFPTGVYLHGMAVNEGNLYIAGGIDTNFFNTNGVYRTAINPDGTIGEWQMEPPLPQPVSGHGFEIRNGILHSWGGAGDFATDAMYTASINADDSLQPWNPAPSLPTTRSLLGSTIGRDSLYSVGGFSPDSPKDTYYLPDRTPPNAATDLSGNGQNGTSIRLTWTTTGNDGAIGPVVDGQFDIRYSLNPADFASFDTIPGRVLLPASYDPGDAQSTLISGLNPGTDYHFALKALDRAGNASAVSNVAVGKTFYVATSTEGPPRVTLETPTPGYTITIVSPADSAVALQTAPGTLASSVYELSPSGTPLSPLGIVTFKYDSGIDPTGLAIYKYIDATASWSTAPITSQVIDTVNFTITGRLASTSMYALFIPKKPTTSVAFLADIHPKTLNLKSHGKDLTVYFEGTSPSSHVADIDAKTVEIVSINGIAISPVKSSDKKSSIGDGNENGIPDLKIKYPRRELQRLLLPGSATLTFSGRLKGGKSFVATGALKVKHPAANKKSTYQVRFSPLSDELRSLMYFSSATKEDSLSYSSDKKRVAKGRFAVRIPDGERIEIERITVSNDVDQHSNRHSRNDAAGRSNLQAASEAVDFGPSGTRFDNPVTIELPYTRSGLPSGVSEDNLAVYYWNPLAQVWEKIPSIIDKSNQVVRGLTNHFSVYQVFAQQTAATASGFGEVYAYPNPARGGANPVIHVEAPGADTVRVNIYDVTGARRHALTMTGAGAAHEMTWDVSGIGSGVYYYVIEASGGGSTFRKSGKLAVIK